MTYLPQYYRRCFNREKNFEQVIGSIKNKTETYDKIEKTLDSIYSSSKSLQSLKFKDTENLCNILQHNDIELNPLFKSSGYVVLADSTEDNDKMDVDTESKDAEKDEKEEINALALTKETLHRHISLEELSGKPSLLVVGLKNLPNDVLEFAALVENILDHVIKLLSDRVQSCKRKNNGEEVSIYPGFQWSYMGVKTANLDTQTVYVVFDDAMMLYLFLKIMDSLALGDGFQQTSICRNKELDEKVIPKLNEFFEIDFQQLQTITKDVKSHILEMARIGLKAKKKNTPADDYLTRFKRLAETYHVDPKDLSDVPTDMIDVVKQDIIDFRLHVLTNLENKQKERMLKDRIEAQKQLGQLQNGAKEVVYNERSVSTGGYPENGNKHGMSDIEFESMLQNKEKSTLEKNYYFKLGQYKKKEDARLKSYMNFQLVQKSDAYVSKVIPQNRKRFFDNFISNVKDANNKIDLNFSYYTKHANYAKYREKVKLGEEAKDLLDVEEEAREDKLEPAQPLGEPSSEGPVKVFEKKHEPNETSQIKKKENTEDLQSPDDEPNIKMEIDNLPSEDAEKTGKFSKKSNNIDNTILKIIYENTGVKRDLVEIEFVKTFLKTSGPIDKRSKAFREFKQQLKEKFDLKTETLNEIIDVILQLKNEP